MPSPWFPVAILVVVGATFAVLTRRLARSPRSFIRAWPGSVWES